MALAKVTISNRQKEIEIPVGIKKLMKSCCEAVLKTEGFQDPAEVSISFVSNEQIREINRDFRNIDSATDVLSFPLGENGEYDTNMDTGNLELGDMVISLQRAEEQATEFGHTLQREVAYLTVHSMLHLLGYDHVNGGEEQIKMRKREEEVLALLGLQRENNYVE